MANRGQWKGSSNRAYSVVQFQFPCPSHSFSFTIARISYYGYWLHSFFQATREGPSAFWCHWNKKRPIQSLETPPTLTLELYICDCSTCSCKPMLYRTIELTRSPGIRRPVVYRHENWQVGLLTWTVRDSETRSISRRSKNREFQKFYYVPKSIPTGHHAMGISNHDNCNCTQCCVPKSRTGTKVNPCTAG